MLYTFGSALDFDWQVWLHMLIATSVILMGSRRPYVSAVDQEVELFFALLALAGIAHISSIFLRMAIKEWKPAYSHGPERRSLSTAAFNIYFRDGLRETPVEEGDGEADSIETNVWAGASVANRWALLVLPPHQAKRQRPAPR
jgi:hypothetical protein